MYKDVIFWSLISALGWFFYWLYSLYDSPSSRVSRQAPRTDEFSVARRKLIGALFGDHKAADRLIAHEYAKFGCSWLEAANRAFESLQRDRSHS
jgi:hypothetical protein